MKREGEFIYNAKKQNSFTVVLDLIRDIKIFYQPLERQTKGGIYYFRRNIIILLH